MCFIAATTAYTFWQSGDLTDFDEFLELSFGVLTALVGLLVLHDSIAVIYQWITGRPIPRGYVR